MTTPLKPTLRYFDARGRAQFIRYYLRARGVLITGRMAEFIVDALEMIEINECE